MRLENLMRVVHEKTNVGIFAHEQCLHVTMIFLRKVRMRLYSIPVHFKFWSCHCSCLQASMNSWRRGFCTLVHSFCTGASMQTDNVTSMHEIIKPRDSQSNAIQHNSPKTVIFKEKNCLRRDSNPRHTAY